MTRILILYPDDSKDFKVNSLNISNKDFTLDDLILNIDDFEKNLSNSIGSLAIFENWKLKEISKIINFWKKDFDGFNIEKCSAIVSTSATTGIPKLCIYDQETLNAISNAPYKEDFRGLSIYSSLNLAHSYLYPGTLLPSINNAEKITLDRTLKPLSFIQNIKKSNSDFLITVPAQLRFWVKFKFVLTQVKKIYTAGGPFPIEIFELIKERFPCAEIFNNYGSTECGPRIGRKKIKTKSDIGIFDNLPDQYFYTDNQITYLHSKRLMFNYLGFKNRLEKFKLQDSIEIKNNKIHVNGRIDDVINFGGKKISENYLRNKIQEINPNIRYSVDKDLSKIVICSPLNESFKNLRNLLSNSLNLEKGYITNTDLEFPKIEK